jgi:hypothetical protein
MTPKEALKRVVSEINHYKLHGIGNENWLGIQDVIKDVAILEKALTPPTADEVCRALSEWVDENDNITYPNEIYYDENRKTFYTYNYLDEWTPIVENGKLLYVMIDLPINIHKMVISFYEGEIK